MVFIDFMSKNHTMSRKKFFNLGKNIYIFLEQILTKISQKIKINKKY